MTQEDKDLLIKDICARMPYGVKVSKVVGDYVSEPRPIRSINLNNIIVEDGEFEDGTPDIDVWAYEDFKPYLFPLSSMTKEQYEEWCNLEADPLDEILTRNANGEKMPTLEHHLLIAKSLTDSVNYCYKNHLDIYGLIPMGLAIDATGKNIY